MDTPTTRQVARHVACFAKVLTAQALVVGSHAAAGGWGSSSVRFFETDFGVELGVGCGCEKDERT